MEVDLDAIEVDVQGAQEAASKWHNVNENAVDQRQELLAPAALKCQNVKGVIERAKAIGRACSLPWLNADCKFNANGGAIPKPTAYNYAVAFTNLYCGKNSLCYDTAKGQPIDEEGEVIDGNYNTLPVLQALARLGMSGITDRGIMDGLLTVAKNNKINSLREAFVAELPEWDGVPRMRTYFRELVQCLESEINDSFMQYWWLSLYNRIMRPGCEAPMALVLVGAQNCGKTSFLNMTASFAMPRNSTARAMKYDFSAIDKEFIRNITGNSVIALCNEMKGLKGSDIARVKSFVDSTQDTLDHKYRAPTQQERQWILCMDTNDVSGLIRDTENRRFFPIVYGQLKPEKGRLLNWIEGDGAFRAEPWKNYKREHFWQIMAECHEWCKHNKYEEFMNRVTDMVQEFSQAAIKDGQVLVRDGQLEEVLLDAIMKCPKEYLGPSNTKISRHSGVVIHSRALSVILTQMGVKDVNRVALARRLKHYGIELTRVQQRRSQPIAMLGSSVEGQHFFLPIVIGTAEEIALKNDNLRAKSGGNPVMASPLWESFPAWFTNEADVDDVADIPEDQLVELSRGFKDDMMAKSAKLEDVLSDPF